VKIRAAVEADARDLAVLADLAGEGLPAQLWGQAAAPGESALDVGARRLAREDANFSYRNARVCVERGEVLGMILAYRLPDPYEAGDPRDTPDVVTPLLALEARVPGSWYVNAIATHAGHRGKGVARRLLVDTQRRAREHGCDRVSLIVASGNTRARALYERLGFRVVATAPVVTFPGCKHGGEWVLMTRATTGGPGVSIPR